MSRRWSVFACLAFAACLLTGCGPQEVRGSKLKGKLLVNGQPLKFLPGERIWITFERAESWGGHKAIMSAGSVQKDGTFEIEGQEKKGTPAGKYNVTIHAEYTRDDAEDRFAPLFASGVSPFVVEVADEADQSFVIDIGKKTITKE
jgi:hypothetical protein